MTDSLLQELMQDPGIRGVTYKRRAFASTVKHATSKPSWAKLKSNCRGGRGKSKHQNLVTLPAFDLRQGSVGVLKSGVGLVYAAVCAPSPEPYCSSVALALLLIK